MCIICIELEKGRLTSLEAFRNMGELSETFDPEHLPELFEAIEEKQKQEKIASLAPAQAALTKEIG